MSAEDFIRSRELPLSIAGCDLVPGPGGTFVIRSRGMLAGVHTTQFHPDGDAVRVVGTAGWFRGGEPKLPIDEHLEALRELGFTRVVLPSGKEYELGV